LGKWYTNPDSKQASPTYKTTPYNLFGILAVMTKITLAPGGVILKVPGQFGIQFREGIGINYTTLF
jgi:hypothetical protein